MKHKQKEDNQSIKTDANSIKNTHVILDAKGDALAHVAVEKTATDALSFAKENVGMKEPVIAESGTVQLKPYYHVGDNKLQISSVSSKYDIYETTNKKETPMKQTSMTPEMLDILRVILGKSELGDSDLEFLPGNLTKLPPVTHPGYSLIDHQDLNIRRNQDDELYMEEPVPNAAMVEQYFDSTRNIEYRVDLATRMPNVADMRYAYKLKGSLSDLERFTNEGTRAFSKMLAFTQAEGHSVYGGTSVGQGNINALDYVDKSKPLFDCISKIPYLSLLGTPAAFDRYGNPMFYQDANILVVSEAEFNKAGLVAGYGGIVTKRDLGQVRILLDEVGAVGKGCAAGYKTWNWMGCKIPDNWSDYDLVITPSDIKTKKVTPGNYFGTFLVTYDNVWTMRGQAVRLSYQTTQYLKPDAELRNSLVDYALTVERPDYMEMLFGYEGARFLKAIEAGESYSPLHVTSLLSEGLAAWGSSFPAVADGLAAYAASWAIDKPFPGTKYNLVLVTQDWVKKAYRYDVEGSSLIWKHPVAAGLIPVSGEGRSYNFIGLNKSTADSFNIDSDGDCVVQMDNFVSEIALRKNLVKEVRNLDIDALTKEKYTGIPDTYSQTELLSRQLQGAVIGRRSNEAYRLDVVNDCKLLDPKYDLDRELHDMPQRIEAPLKAQKHRVDNTRIARWNSRNRHAIRYSRDVVEMPFVNRNKTKIMKSLRGGSQVDMSMLHESRCERPLAYHHFFWDSGIDRADQEVSILMSNKESLDYFADKIKIPATPMGTAYFDSEVNIAKSALALWSQLREGAALWGHAADVARVLSLVGRSLSSEALMLACHEYLMGTASNEFSNGKAIMNLCSGRMNEVIPVHPELGVEVDYSTKAPAHIVLVQALLRPNKSLKKGISFDMAINSRIRNGQLYISRFKAEIMAGNGSIPSLDGLKVRIGIPVLDARKPHKPTWRAWVLIEPDHSISQ